MSIKVNAKKLFQIVFIMLWMIQIFLYANSVLWVRNMYRILIPVKF